MGNNFFVFLVSIKNVNVIGKHVKWAFNSLNKNKGINLVDINEVRSYLTV